MAHGEISSDDCTLAETSLRRFLGFQRLSDRALATTLDVVGALSAWLDDNPTVGNDADRETVGYLFSCLLDDRLTAKDRRSVAGPGAVAWAV